MASRLPRSAAGPILLVLGTAVSAAATPPTPPTPIERRSAPPPTDAARSAVESGRIAFYGRAFDGKRTASGDPFDSDALTMAHRTLPFGTKVRITNPKNGRSVVVRVNDRGPRTRALVGDVSLAAAKELDFVRDGVIDAQLEVVGRSSDRLAERPRNVDDGTPEKK